jgi:hypothetical protein
MKPGCDANILILFAAKHGAIERSISLGWAIENSLF